MRPKILRVGHPPEAFASLIEALSQAGARAGWLQFTPLDPPEGTQLAPPRGLPPWRLPEELEAAAGSGVLRAVAAGGGRSIAVKPMRGAPVARDLLREHFRGCLIVLVRGGEEQLGEMDAPRLEPRGEGWLFRREGEAARALTTDQLIVTLRSPRRMKRKNREE